MNGDYFEVRENVQIAKAFQDLMHIIKDNKKANCFYEICADNVKKEIQEKTKNLEQRKNDQNYNNVKEWEAKLDIIIFMIKSCDDAMQEKGNKIANRKIKKNIIQLADDFIQKSSAFTTSLKEHAKIITRPFYGLKGSVGKKDYKVYVWGFEYIIYDTIEKLQDVTYSLVKNKAIRIKYNIENILTDYNAILSSLSKIEDQVIIDENSSLLSKAKSDDSDQSTVQALSLSLKASVDQLAKTVSEEGLRFDISKLSYDSTKITYAIELCKLWFEQHLTDENIENNQDKLNEVIKRLYDANSKMEQLQWLLQSSYSSELMKFEKELIEGISDQQKKLICSFIQKLIVGFGSGASSNDTSKIRSATATLYTEVLKFAKHHQDLCTQKQLQKKFSSIEQNSAELELGSSIYDILDNIQRRIIKENQDPFYQVNLPGILISLKNLSWVINSYIKENKSVPDMNLAPYMLLSFQLDFKIIPDLQAIIRPITWKETFIVHSVHSLEYLLNVHCPIKDLRSILQFCVEYINTLPPTEQYKQIKEREVDIKNGIIESKSLADTCIDKEARQRVLMSKYADIISDLISREQFSPPSQGITEQTEQALWDLKNFIDSIEGKRLDEIGKLINDKEKFGKLKSSLENFQEKIAESEIGDQSNAETPHFSMQKVTAAMLCVFCEVMKHS